MYWKTFVESPVTHRKKMNQGQSKQWYTENKHEAIISKELWMKAHEMYKKRSDKSKNHRDIVEDTLLAARFIVAFVENDLSDNLI